MCKTNKSKFLAGWNKGIMAHEILVSAQVPLVLTLGLWTSDLGLTIMFYFSFIENTYDLTEINFHGWKSALIGLGPDSETWLQLPKLLFRTSLRFGLTS